MSSKDWLVPFQPTLTTLERPAPLRRKKRPAPHPNAQCKRPAAAMPRRLQPSSPFERTGFFPCGERCKKWWEPWKFSWFHMISYDSGWWWLNHLEKYESQWEGLSQFIPYIMENKSHVPNHRPGLEYDFLNRTCWFLSCNTKTCCGQSVHSRTNLGFSGHLAGSPDIIPYLKWSSTAQSCCFASSSVQD